MPQKPEAAQGGLRVETWIFLGLTGFFALAAVVYGLLAPTEAVGIVALSLTAGLTLIIGTFLRFISRRLEQPRPEDNDDAEVSDGAGDVGFFSPGSYWPITLAFSAANAVWPSFSVVRARARRPSKPTRMSVVSRRRTSDPLAVATASL